MMPPRAIVTGAASGIGLACAKRLLAAGSRIAALDLREAAMAPLVAAHPDQVLTMGVDVADPAQCATAIDKAVEYLGGVDALLHFAGAWSGTTWEHSMPDEWVRILAINTTGTFFLCKAVAPHMVRQKAGAIVLTASDSAKVGGVAGGPAYVASKGAVIGLTRSLARNLGAHGVRVNAVNPGVVDTPMTSGWPAEVLQGAIRQTPLGRLAKPDDVADVALFLASDEARFITGEVTEVNGGAYFD